MRAVLLLIALTLFLHPAVAAASRTYAIHAGTNSDGSMYFKDASGSKDLNVGLGDNVTIHVYNDDITASKNVTTPHDLAILGLGTEVTQSAEVGECPAAQEETGPKVAFEVCMDDEVEKSFDASKAGTFTFKCEVPGHAAKGMQGTFTVAAASTAAKTPGAPVSIVLAGVGLLAVALRARRSA